jgi:phage terminase large subunit
MPNNWNPYNHQIDLWNYLDDGGKRAVVVWHRRSGKDSTAINYTATEAISRPGVYWHMLPTQRQARKVIWDGIDRKGRRVVDQAFPKAIVEAKRIQEMQLELKNGSIWQLCGSDNYDALVGANPVGVVFSEWSLCNPAAWNYIRPILAENGGWALFIYTSRGKNHGYTMAEMARKNPKWYYSKLTVEDTKRDDGSRIITDEAIQEDRDSNMSEDMIQQEYYCSFEVAIPGAIFAQEIATARADGRITFVPIEKHLKTFTFWDLGISKGNAMVVWWAQTHGKEIRLINHYEAENKGIPHFIDQVNGFAREHDIKYDRHYAPHDIGVRDMFTMKTREQTALEMNMVFTKVPRTTNLNDSIEAARKIFARCWFDQTRCEAGINALASYHRIYDEKLDTFKDEPVHDWASNSADAFRQLAQAWGIIFELNKKIEDPKPFIAESSFDVFA